jgi:hypothetical protein
VSGVVPEYASGGDFPEKHEPPLAKFAKDGSVFPPEQFCS